ncbi:hypothetical protein BKA69DRAFT_167373 [Paraphysoderma sedebokerense]|nr:hypothetical protein BKA69DRAFT_167373 [Paraphysoderma sedebokerense]
MPLYSLYFRFFVLSVVLLFTVTAVALDYSPFYLNASWTNTISSLTTIVDSVFDENINVVYIVDSQFKAYRLNYHTLSSPVTKDWSSVVDSGMRPWSHERITKNAAQSVNPYSPEVFLATYCYDSNGKSIIRVHRFDQNLNQISSMAYSSVAFVSDFFDGQYRNPRLKLYFESASTLHVALFHDGSRGRNAWLAKIKIAYGSSPSISKLDDKTLPDAAVAIDFGCNSGFVCIWTTTRTVTPYSLADYSKGSSVTIAASSNEINYDPAMERYGNVTLYFHRQINDTTKLILHSKNTSFNSLAANTLPYKYDFPVQLNTAIQISQLGVACVGFTSNNIDSSPGRSYDIIILRYNASFYRASTTIISTTKQDNLTLLIPRTTSDTFSVVGTTDGSIDEPDVTASKPRVIFLAHFQPFNISSVQPALVAPGQAITIQFSQLPLNAISMGFPRVVYNGQQCTGVAWNSSTLRANVGSGVGGPYELSVTFDYLPFKPSVVADSMLAFQDPVILNISPSVGPASGFPINITMDPIGNVTQPLVVSIGGRPCANVVQTSSNSLRCNVGPGTGQNHSVVVRIGASQSNGSAFISYNAPVLSQVVPSVGPAAGSNEVNLTYYVILQFLAYMLTPL